MWGNHLRYVIECECECRWLTFRESVKAVESNKDSPLHFTAVNCHCSWNNSDNLGQNVWNKIKKSSKIGEDDKVLISITYFLTAIANVELLRGRLGTRIYLQPNLRIS